MSRSIIFSGLFVAAIGLAACGDSGDGGDGEPSGDAGCGTDTYANYAQAYLTTNCTAACHGANAATLGDNARFDTLDGVKTHKTHIMERAVELKMPIMPSGSTGLPAAERERLKKWLDCNTP